MIYISSRIWAEAKHSALAAKLQQILLVCIKPIFKVSLTDLSKVTYLAITFSTILALLTAEWGKTI